MKRYCLKNNLIGDEQGAILVLVGCLLGLFLIIMSLVVDTGLSYQERRQLQTAVDSAALAAAQDLAEGRGQEVAEQTVWDYVSNNSNVVAEMIQATFPEENSVHVEARTSRDLFIARIFGKKDAKVEAKATARFGPATSVGNLVPFIVPYQVVSSHVGPENTISFELGEDRPLDPFRKEHIQNGTLTRYVITYTNTANKTVSLKVEDPLPSGVTYVDGSASAGGIYNSTENKITWNFSQVTDGETLTLTFDISTGSELPVNSAYAYVDGSAKSTVAKDDSNTAQKGYFWLCDFDDGSGGTPDYTSWIINGYPEEVSIGLKPNGEGMKVALKNALDTRKTKDPSVVLPLFDYTLYGGSNGRYSVIGFAEFIIVDFNLSSNPKTISGYFTNGTVTTGAGGGIQPDYYFGVDVVWLDQ